MKEKAKSKGYKFIALQLALMLIISAVITTVISAKTKKSSIEHMKTVSSSRVKILLDYVQHAENTLAMYSSAQEIVDVVTSPDDEKAVKAAQLYTENFSEKILNLEGIYVSEWNTHVLAHTNPAVVGITTRTEEKSLKQLQDAMIESSKKGNGVYDTGIILSPASGQQIVSMYRGVFDENGKPLGLVGLGVYTTGLIEMLNDFKIKGLENAEYYMVNVLDGTYILNEDTDKISVDAENEYVKSLCEEYISNDKDDIGSFEYIGDNGKKYISVYYYVADYNWLLIFEDTESEAFLLSFTMKIYLIVFCTAIAAIMIFVILEVRHISVKQNELNRLKEKKYRDSMDSIVHALPDTSISAKIDLYKNEVIDFKDKTNCISSKLELVDGKIMMKNFKYAVDHFIIDDYDKKTVSDLIDSDNLLRMFGNDEKNKEHTYSVISAEGSLERVKLTVKMFENPVKNTIEAIIQIDNISDEYYEKSVGSHLVLKQYKKTGLIFIKESKCRFLMTDTNTNPHEKWFSYDTYRKKLCSEVIDIHEIEDFYEQISVESIKSNLDNGGDYSVYVHFIDPKTKEKRYAKYEFRYLDISRETVLFLVADVTTEFETDPLTGINNYKGFLSQAAYIIENSRSEDQFSVMITNIKWFKAVNKMFGLKACDEFLIRYAQDILASKIKPVLVGRLPASDHFMILVNRKDLDFDELADLMRQKIVSDGKEINVSVVCGVYYVLDKTIAVSEMIGHAIMASKNIKDVYKCPYAVFSEKEEEAYLSSKLVLSEFEMAMKNGEFVPFYQPIFDAKTHEVVSAEALVRWKKGDNRYISPGMFIPVLEENGSVSKVDLCISNRVTEFVVDRKKNGKKYVPVSINLSGMNFYDNDVVNGVMNDISKLVENDILPKYEITETAWAGVAEQRSRAIAAMREKGTQILIDDFGSGYSSFSTIRDFNFDILKIDMGFIRKIGTSQKADGIVCSIIDMAHIIGMKVVAEGVETKEHLDFLAEHECDYIQGYYFSKPLPQDEFEALLDKSGL